MEVKVELARVALVREDASSIAKLYGYRLHMSIRMHQYVGSLPGKVFELAFPFPLFFSFLLFFFFWCLVGTTLLTFLFLFLFWRGRYFFVAQLKSYEFPTDSSPMHGSRCTNYYTHAKPSNRGWTSLTRSKGIRKGSIMAYKAQSRGWNVANSGKLLICFTSGGPTGVASGPTARRSDRSAGGQTDFTNRALFVSAEKMKFVDSRRFLR